MWGSDPRGSSVFVGKIAELNPHLVTFKGSRFDHPY